MGFYESLRDNTARPLITKFGQAIILKVTSVGTFNPVTGTTSGTTTADYAGNGVVESYSTKDIDGTVIKQGDKKVIAVFDNTTVVPSPNDNLSIAGTIFTVQNVDSIEPAGVSVIYTLQVRR